MKATRPPPAPLSQPLLSPNPESWPPFLALIWPGQGWAEGLQEKQRERWRRWQSLLQRQDAQPSPLRPVPHPSSHQPQQGRSCPGPLWPLVKLGHETVG